MSGSATLIQDPSARRTKDSQPSGLWIRILRIARLTMAFTLALPCSATSLFHDPNGAAFADLAIDGHRETWPFAADSFDIGCDVDTMRRPATPRARRQSGRRSICLRRAPSLTPRSARFTSESLNTTVTPISTSPTKIGKPSDRAGRMAGRHLLHRFGSVVPPACCRFLFRRGADRSKPSQHSSIF